MPYKRKPDSVHLQNAPDVEPLPASSSAPGTTVDLSIAADEAKEARMQDHPSVNDAQVANALQAEFNALVEDSPMMKILRRLEVKYEQN